MDMAGSVRGIHSMRAKEALEDGAYEQATGRTEKASRV